MSIHCIRPRDAGQDEALRWLCREAGRLRAVDGVEALRIVVLEEAGRRWPAPWDFLVELELRDGLTPEAVVDGPAGVELLGDMRLLGMMPSLAVARGERTTTL